MGPYPEIDEAYDLFENDAYYPEIQPNEHPAHENGFYTATISESEDSFAGLDDNEIEKMVQDAEENAESDKKKREDVETRNQAEALVNGAEKAIEDAGDKADENLKSSVQESLSDLKSALEGEDLEEIKKKSEALSQVMMKLGEAAYKDLPDQENASSEEDKSKNDDADVVDADFEEVDNDKKDK